MNTLFQVITDYVIMEAAQRLKFICTVSSQFNAQSTQYLVTCKLTRLAR